MLIVYAATEPEDRVEGKGGMRTFALFTKEDDAKRAVQGRGVMGFGDGTVLMQQVYESYAEFDATTSDDIRKRALAKLTPQERAALGLENR